MHPSLFDSDDGGEWLPCELINGNVPLPHHEAPHYRVDEHGLHLKGLCTGGEPGKPQFRVPPFAIAWLRGKISQTYPPPPVINFDTGEITIPPDSSVSGGT